MESIPAEQGLCLGKRDVPDKAISILAGAYADQTLCHHPALVEDVEYVRIVAEVGV